MVLTDLLISKLRLSQKYEPINFKRLNELEKLLKDKKTVGEIDFNSISFDDLSLLEKFHTYSGREKEKVDRLIHAILKAPRKQGGIYSD